MCDLKEVDGIIILIDQSSGRYIWFTRGCNRDNW